MNSKVVDSTSDVSFLGKRKFGASAGASSSTTNLEVPEGVYEVFLSFCGIDTRKSFTDFLYTYLVDASIQTFRDDEELKVGEEIGPEILEAIKESKISIPIFSKNYASSRWCLMELEQMVECHINGKQMIYPIFYDVTPYDVQNQTGSYEIAFSQHGTKFDRDTVQRWRDALRVVAGLKGLELQKVTDGHEGRLVKIVVEKVLRKLKKNYTKVPDNLVGIDNHIEEMEGLLKVDSNDVRIVGIHGMGGLGKTTIAKAIYNKLGGHFDGRCFLGNIRENSKHCNDIVNLQMQLISNIQNRGVLSLIDLDQGRSVIKGVVRGKKLLVILDDVDDNYQVNMLIGDQSWFSAGSRIIITTRDRKVLEGIESSGEREDPCAIYKTYEPDLMEDHHALQLFCKYAFMRDTPLEGYEIFSEEVVSIAKGLPLVLVVFGSDFFLEKDKDLWEEKLRQLRIIPSEKVMDKLKFSFDGLQHVEKQIFLDIACFFIGTDIRMATYMWNECGFFPRLGLRVLDRKSLIKCGDDYKVIMHDHIRDLGLQIIREENLNEPGKRSRLLPKEALEMLETCQGTESVQAIHIEYGGIDEPEGTESIQAIPIELDKDDDEPKVVLQQRLPNLRFLRSIRLEVEGNWENLFPNLRWLECRLGKFWAINLNMKNLVVLNLAICESITDDWEGWNQLKMATKLKFLNLSHCHGASVLPSLSALASLEILILTGCSIITRLDGLQQLKSLKHMDASFCPRLKGLPDLSNLTKLVVLNLKFCTVLAEIRGLEKLEFLEVLNLGECVSLRTLPNISNLKNLRKFTASDCHNLTQIEGLPKLNSLRYLNLSGCDSLEDVGDLSNLKLDLLYLPDFSNPKKLEKLESFNHLIEFHGLDRLEEIYLSKCNLITRLPNLSYLKRLRKIDVNDCCSLTEIEDLEGLESLEHLSVVWCLCLERLPNLSNFRKLEELDCSGCDKIIEIQGIDKLESLKVLKITSCHWRLPDLPNFGMLEHIELQYCKRLEDVQGLGVIESLESLSIGSCYKLRELPDFLNLKNLKILCIDSLPDLAVIHGLEALRSLERLELTHCKNLSGIHGLEELKSLKQLILHKCTILSEIHGLEELKSLVQLELSDCENLSEIHGLEELKSLKLLDIRDSEGIQNLPYMPNVTIWSGPSPISDPISDPLSDSEWIDDDSWDRWK